MSKPVFAFLNSALLWGAAAIAVPVLIHLLLRQRPRPRQWAAMRWLLAAAQRAQRQYKLTNLLLLLLRCLLVALLALALARPSITGVGQGGRLVLVVDTTASMGPITDGPGALQAVRESLSNTSFSHNEIALVTVSPRVRLRAIGNASNLANDATSLQASALPGGLDAAVSDTDELLEACTEDSDVILVSDFRQDEGSAVMALLEGRVRSVTRWRVGEDHPNAIVTKVTPPADLLPNTPATIDLQIDGRVERASIAIDDGMPLPTEPISAPERLRVPVPGIASGQHIVTIDLIDEGLLSDNRIEVPVEARERVPVLVVAQQPGRMHAALSADRARLDLTLIPPTQPLVLPTHGLTVIRDAVSDPTSVIEWLKEGGVLWIDRDTLAQMPALAEIAASLLSSEELLPGGAVLSGESDLDANLDRITVLNIPALTPSANDEVLLSAGDAPLVVATAVNRGWLVIEALEPSSNENRLPDAGAYPLWIRRRVREFTARLTAPEQWVAGISAPRAVTLRKNGAEVVIDRNQPLLIAPGLWTDVTTNGAHAPIVVLPNRAEGLLRQRVGDEVATAIDDALPETRGSDLSLPLLIALLIVAIGEGLFAAWAGRRYGR